jgi:hypothetical protein
MSIMAIVQVVPLVVLVVVLLVDTVVSKVKFERRHTKNMSQVTTKHIDGSY